MSGPTFDALCAKYGQWDYCVWAYSKIGDLGWHRYRCYSDGAWMEGHWVEPVIYWGA